MASAAAVLAFDQPLPSAVPPPALAPQPPVSDGGPFIDVGGDDTPPPAAPAPAPAPPAANRIVVPVDSPLTKYAGQVLHIAGPNDLPEGITVPAGAKYPLRLDFGQVPAPPTFSVVTDTAPATPPAAPSPASGQQASRDPLARVLAADAASDAALAAGRNAPNNASTTPQTAAPTPATKPIIDLSGGVKTGYAANIAAGANEGMTGLLGAPADLAHYALDLVPRGINAVAGTHIPDLPPPVGGSAWLNSALGLVGADPRDVTPADAGQQLARAGAGGAVSAVMPMGAAGRLAEAASPVVAGIGRTLGAAPVGALAASGALAGASGTIATDLAQHAGVPASYLPIIDTVGQLAGGGLGALGTGAGMAALRGGRAALGAATGAIPTGPTRSFLDALGAPVVDSTTGQPVTATQSQLGRVGATIAKRAGMTPGQLSEQLPPPLSREAVPGSVPTAGQRAGNLGLLNLERDLGNASSTAKQAFADRRVQQNSAQLARLRTMAPQDAQAEAAGNYFVGRLNAIDAQEAVAIQAAEAKFAALEKQIGGQAHPSDVGKLLAHHVAEHFRPAVDGAEHAIRTAAARVNDLAEAAGVRAGVEGESARQQYGEALRTALDAIRAKANEERAKLYAARDPDGRLALDVGPIHRAAAGLRAEINPAAGDRLTGREEELIAVGEALPAVSPMRTVAAFRKNVNAALQEATAGKNVGTPGAAEAVRRLTMLKQSVDHAEAEATERAARAEGPAIAAGISPRETVVGRLAEHVAEPSGGSVPRTGTSIYTPSGRRLDVHYRVVDAGTLRGSHGADGEPNPAFPAELQPRDRSRAASAAQVQRIAGNLQPERLGASASAMEGAPIVGPDGVVESGNARYLALRQAYARHPESAKAYRDFLKAKGFNAAGMKEPVLVRQRVTALTPSERIKFTQEANAGAGLALSAGERAAIDAHRLPAETLDLYHGGDVTAGENRDFVRGFIKHAVEKGEEGSILTRDGGLSVEGAQRIRNALLQKAYGDTGLVAALAENGDENLKAFGGALQDAAGGMARLRQAVQSGHVDRTMDISRDLLEAGRAVSLARARGVSLRDLVAQRDAFGGGVSQEAEAMLRRAYGENLNGRLSRVRLANLLRDYAEGALRQTTEARLFGQNATSQELLEQAAARHGSERTTRAGSGKATAVASADLDGANNREVRNPGRGPRPAENGAGNPGESLAAEPIRENLTAEDAARFKAADAFNAEYQRRFGPKTAAGEVLARGPGGDFKMALSKVAANFWKRGPAGAESAQQLVRAMGSREAAERAIGGYAAYDLRAYAEREGGLDTKKLAAWLHAHADALNEFPNLRKQFNTLNRAQGVLDDLKAKRAEIDALNPIRSGQTGADTLAQFVKPGPKGGEAVDAYLKNTGNTPISRAALADAFAHTLRTGPLKDGGEMTTKGYDAWRAKYASALDRVPLVRAQFDTLADAMRAVEDAAARAAQARRDYLDSAAGHYITKGGEPVEPQVAVRSVLNSPTGPADARDLVQQMRGDKAALNGLRLNFADALAKMATNTGEAGTSGESEISSAALQKIVKNDRTMGVLREVFGPEKVRDIVEAVAEDARLSARSHNATKIPGSPGTAADWNATHADDPHSEFASVAGAELAGEVIGHVLGLGPLMRVLVRGGSIAGKTYYSAARAAGIQTERDLMAQALLHPEILRAALTAARQPVMRPAIMTRLNGLIAHLAAGGATMPQVPNFQRQNAQRKTETVRQSGFVATPPGVPPVYPAP